MKVGDKRCGIFAKSELRRELLKRRGEVNNPEAERAVFEKLIKENSFLSAEVIFYLLGKSSGIS